MVCSVRSSSDLVAAVKREFHSQAKLLNHHKPEQFATSQWILVRGDVDSNKGCISVFLIYRWLLALYFLCALGVSIAEPRFLGKSESGERRAKWPVYLTNWAYVLLTSHVVLAAVLATKHHLNLWKPAEAMTLLHKTYWVFNNVSNALAPCISLCYWIILFNPTIHIVDFTNVSSHIMNAIITVVDLFIAAHPIRLLHCYQPVLVALAYTVFSAAYFLAGGTNRDNSPNIYPILNWGDHPWRTLLLAFGSAILLIIVHVTLWLLYLLRRRIAIALVPKPIHNKEVTLNTVTAGIA